MITGKSGPYGRPVAGSAIPAAVRGAFDESSLDAPHARAAARGALGPAAFDAAYRSAAGTTYQTALDLARAALSS